MQYICKCKLIESIVTKYGKDNYCSTFNADFFNIVCTGFNVDCEGWTQYEQHSNVEESKMHPGFYAGMGAGYVIDETWSVRPSLLFTMKGVKQNYKF